MIVDDALAACPELDWPPVPRALSYRVLVRDDNAGEVVTKDGFVAPPGRIDFSRLDPSHLHRARVQAWIDDEWHDHLPYRTVLPPPEQTQGEVVELACPHDANAVAYRFSVRPVRGDGPALDLDVTEPRVRIPAAILTNGVLSQWHVSVRREQAGEWEPYLPEIVIPDEQFMRQPELAWSEVEGALAYRIVIRDRELDRTVAKLGFLSSPGRVDWSALDISHQHRARVQASVAGGWRDHLPYRIAFPPPELLLRPVSPSPSTDVEHVVVVHFPAHHLDAPYGVRRPDALLVSRLNLFERLTLPSLGLLARAGALWFLVPDPDLPEPIMASLRDLCGEHLLGENEAPRPTFGAGGRWVAVAWLTAGDALHPGVPAAVDRRIAALQGNGGEPVGIGFPLSVEAGPAGARLARNPALASFVVVVEPPGTPVDPTDRQHPILHLRSLDAQLEDWSVPALLRARPGPNEHPIFLRERGPEVAMQLLASFGAEPSLAGAPSQNSSALT